MKSHLYTPSWFGKPETLYDVTFSSVLDATTATVSEDRRDIDVLYDNKKIGNANEQIQIVPTRVVLFCIDGFGVHWFTEAAKNSPILKDIMGKASDSGETPTFKKGVMATAVSALPSITWCNWASVLTGKPPKEHGVYGNSFFRRDMPALMPIFSGNDNVGNEQGGIGDFFQFGERVPAPLRATQQGLSWLLHGGNPDHPEPGPKVQTVFEQLPAGRTSASLLTWYGRGANYETHFTWSFLRRQSLRLVVGAGESIMMAGPTGGAGLLLAGGGQGLGVVVGAVREYGELKGHEPDGSSAKFADKFAMDQGVSAYFWGRKPGLTAIYLPGPDNYGHANGHDGGSVGFHDTTNGNRAPGEQYQSWTDAQIGNFRKRVAAAGLQNATVYVFTSDHGQTVTNHTVAQGPNVSDSHDLELRWENGVKEQVLTVIKGARPFPELNNQTFLANQMKDHRNASIIYSPNGGLAYIYARTPGGSNTDGTLWSTPDNSLIHDLAVALWTKSHDPAPAPPAYSFHGALGEDPVVLVRQTGAFLDMNSRQYPDTFQIMALSSVGRDANLRIITELVSLETIAARHPDWADFPRRIRDLDDMQGSTPTGTRCGDIIIVPDTKAGFNAVHEGDAYPGWHGGPSIADSNIPLAVASEALSVDGANQGLRGVIDAGRAEGTAAHQNQDITRIVLKIFDEVK